ncbi:MAG: RusA family crossover junction endodeoxyribonuclease [Zoogloea oleivorans]|jgi:Holliday junction resolvase RusA-like endonuclease|uniref:RusA family crossover junction endodeoxyribonuclease n=1 Tax=Zoogloea oleivorans TaxID=1552750 RepID=UPI002A3704B4|nr:RusA family crossover junction endodeoxyribonuclease [Zoogloea oleivorans]MDY0037975.1 RusA family crossover junction endodeoxyribonuclease [Zoogloea oleivorans]
MSNVSFFVPGIPVPKGSAKAFVNKRTGRAQVMQDNREKQKPWASAITLSAMQYGVQGTLAPVKVDLVFAMPRLKSHFGTGKNATSIKPNAPLAHVSKPDLDKLIRCVLDALTGVAWHDDSQVFEVRASKFYSSRPGVTVTLEAFQKEE